MAKYNDMHRPSLCWTTFSLLASILTVTGHPFCQIAGDQQKDIVCTKNPSDTDVILRRNLVSDNAILTRITLKECDITAIDFEAFQNLNALEYLDLSINRIPRLRLGVLDGTKNVKFLNLSYNLLTDFPLGLFDQKPNLEILDLKGNRISKLTVGVFDALTKLKHLDLSSNALNGRNLNPNLFDKSKLITYMDFSRNVMNNAPGNLLQSFKALEFLNLDRCSLKQVPAFATAANLKPLKHLMLSTNQITGIINSNTFMELDNLEILNLAENFIDNLHEDVFKPLRKLKYVVLRNNRLQSLPDKLFQNLPMLNNIDLSYNLIGFVPVSAFRGTVLQNLNLSHNRFSYLTDNFLLELKNSGANIRKFYFNNNPWQCACLLQMLKETKSLGVNYNGVKYGGKHPVCVTSNEFNCKRQPNFNQDYVELYNNLIN